MKRILLAAAISALALQAVAADVGVSISVGQPGFYGQLDIGSFPQPPLVYSRPLLGGPGPIGVARQPLYLHVPPGHYQNWRRYCGNYNACGRPVYFVQDRWYNNVYVPQYRQRHYGRGDYRRGDDRRWDHDRRDDNGHDRDHDGRGHDH